MHRCHLADPFAKGADEAGGVQQDLIHIRCGRPSHPARPHPRRLRALRAALLLPRASLPGCPRGHRCVGSRTLPLPSRRAVDACSIQQRSGRKTLTTVQGIAPEYDQKRLVKAFKKQFACNGSVASHPEYGEVIQLQGDQRMSVCEFLTQVGIAQQDQLKVHGF